jgi:hypothetical protein
VGLGRCFYHRNTKWRVPEYLRICSGLGELHPTEGVSIHIEEEARVERTKQVYTCRYAHFKPCLEPQRQVEVGGEEEGNGFIILSQQG